MRSNWLSLNGVWQFQPANDGDPVPFGQSLSGDILVPFPVESAISGVMQHYDRLWYRRTFTVPAGWAGKRIKLNFGAVDYQTQVYVNGQSAGSHTGGYDPFSIDITPYLNGTGTQEIIVGVYDPTQAGGQPRGKQTTTPVSITYTSTTGIWQTVWLEPVDANGSSGIKMVPDIDTNTLKLTVTTPTTAGLAVSGIVTDPSSGATIQTFSGAPNTEISIPVPNARYWSPSNPFLYNISISVTLNGTTIDTLGSYFAMRKISLATVGSARKIFLNNQFLFQMGVLDQGYWPDGNYTAPTEAALVSDIQTMKSLGFNTVRVHQKVQPARYYYWTDKLGLLVWQDMPSCNNYNYNVTPPAPETAEFESELVSLVRTHINSPSIIMWTVFNEGGEGRSQFNTEALVSEVQTLDPSRLVNEASGGTYHGVGQVRDGHHYSPPANPTISTMEASVCGEWGGIGYFVTGHLWPGNPGGNYGLAYSAQNFQGLYGQDSLLLKNFRDNNNLCGAIYTQLTDVENECNGLMTYDRLLKVDAGAINLSNRLQYLESDYMEVAPTSESTGQPWKYTITPLSTYQDPDHPPASNWNKTTYDDSAWSTGLAGFGNTSNSSAHVRTVWNTSPSDIWLRRTFNPGPLTATQIDRLVLRNFHDDRVNVYLNGISALSANGSLSAYGYDYLNPAAKNTIASNAVNLLAVRCRQGGGGQYIDAGLSLEIPITDSYFDDFASSSTANWSLYGGTWSLSGGKYTVNAGAGYKALITGTNFNDFVYDADVSINGGNAGLIFRTTNPGVGADTYFGYYAGLSSNSVQLGRAANSWIQIASTPMAITANTMYHMRIVNVGSSIKVYVNDMISPKITATDGSNQMGAAGLRSFLSAATFDNVTVGSLKYLAEFSGASAPGWTTYGGTWTVTGGQYTVTPAAGAKAIIDHSRYSDFTYDADVSFNGNDAGLIFRASNPGIGADALCGYYVGLNAAHVVLGKENNNWSAIVTAPLVLASNTMHHVRVVAKGTNIKVYVNDMTTPLINTNDSTFADGAIGFRAQASAAKYDNVMIY